MAFRPRRSTTPPSNRLSMPGALAVDPNLADADVRLWLLLASMAGEKVAERDLMEQRDSVMRLVEHGYLALDGDQIRLLEGRAAA